MRIRQLTAIFLTITALLTSCGTKDDRKGSGDEENKFLVTFKDENGQTLQSKEWDEGSVPSYTYNKADTAEWDYTFEGWSLTQNGEVATIVPAYADIIYYAVITNVKQRYTVTFVSNGGNEVSPINNEYGASISEPTEPTKDGYRFVAWSYDSSGNNEVEWPFTLTKNQTLYANWNEKVNLKSYLLTLMGVVNHDPYSYIPEKMRPTNSGNYVTATQVDYDFNNFTNVSNIKYGGFGEQWHMVLENIEESQRFYAILGLCETAINASVILFNNYLDNNPSNTASHSLNETEYTASLNFSAGVLSYNLQYKTNFTIPFLGEVHPQIAMTYNILTLEKAVRIQLTENNAMKYIIKDDSYVFALQYGIAAVNRKAYFSISKAENNSIEGHIYEYVQLKDKDLIPNCADFYIGDVYTSVVGNKASGMPGFSGYVNELYKTSEGKLLGYEVRETFTKWGVSATYHTLWFNLNNISGITSVKAVKNEESTFGLGANNNHNIYLNGSSSIFEPTYNKQLFVNTSRKYDVELRKQYFYGYNGEDVVAYETSIPMMFIQANHDNYTNFSDFPSDILSKSSITANVTLASTYLNKIQSDYATLVDIFEQNLFAVTGTAIGNFIG